MGWPGIFRLLALEECLRAVGEDRSGRAHHPSASVGSEEEHWAHGVLLLRCPLPEGGWGRLTVAMAPGLAAVFRIVPPSDKVALGETVRRVLSASSTPT